MGFAARQSLPVFGSIGMNYCEVSKTGQMGAEKSRRDLLYTGGQLKWRETSSTRLLR